jgi:hypothetical protein
MIGFFWLGGIMSIFRFLCFVFLFIGLTGCASNGFQRNYIISQEQNTQNQDADVPQAEE